MFGFAIDGVPTGTRLETARLSVNQTATLKMEVRFGARGLLDITNDPTASLVADGGTFVSKSVWRANPADAGKTITSRYRQPNTGQEVSDTVKITVRP